MAHQRASKYGRHGKTYAHAAVPVVAVKVPAGQAVQPEDDAAPVPER